MMISTTAHMSTMIPDTGEAAAPWTPADIDGAGLRFWYDGVGSVSGSALLDLSSNNMDMTKVGTVNTGTEQLNGIDVLQFVGGRYTSDGAASVWKYLHDGTANIIFFAVAKFGTVSSPEATYGLLGTDGGSSANIGVSMYYDDAGAQEDAFQIENARGTGGNFRTLLVVANKITANTWHLIGGRWDSNADVVTGEVDGVDIGGTPTGTGALTTSNPTNTLQLGAVGNSVVPLTGSVAEIFAFDSGSVGLSTARGYLQNKYAI